MSYTMSSEWVSPGHPDRVADVIAASLIQRIQQKDGANSHSAIEVMLANDLCIIGGEATTSLDLNEEAPKAVSEALKAIGYDEKYREKFTKDECYVDGDYKIEVHVNRQSPDIAQGVGRDKGFNDQGVFCSSAEVWGHNKMGLAQEIATTIGDRMMKNAKDHPWFGIDIKTLVSVRYNDNHTPNCIEAITLAIPTISGVTRDEYQPYLESFVDQILTGQYKNYYNGPATVKITINGTGDYHIHGSLGDTGLTGRKLAVNCNSLYSPIGGGSLVKPAHASDLLLFLAARHISKAVVESGKAQFCEVQLSCAIGQKKLQSFRLLLDHEDIDSALSLEIQRIAERYFDWSPAGFDRLWNMYQLPFMQTAITNFIGSDNYAAQPWENTTELRRLLADILPGYENAVPTEESKEDNNSGQN